MWYLHHSFCPFAIFVPQIPQLPQEHVAESREGAKLTKQSKPETKARPAKLTSNDEHNIGIVSKGSLG